MDDLPPGRRAGRPGPPRRRKDRSSSTPTRFTRRETDDNGEQHEHAIPFLKSYTVFNTEQIDGLPAHYYARADQPAHALDRIERAERFIAATAADIRHGGTLAYYTPTSDFVQMPPFESFRRAEAYYATLAHELCHWTRHPSRLAREFGRQRWGDEGYAIEELVAELGAAFLCADLGLTPEIRDDHAALHRILAEGAEERQARRLHRRQPRPARRRLPARLAACSRTASPNRQPSNPEGVSP